MSAHTAVIGATSATSLAIPGSQPATNQTVTLVATVNSSSGNAGPSGSITFFNGSSPISGCINEAVTPTGQSVSIDCHGAFGAGSVSLTAVYTRGSGSLVASSASSPTTLNITKDSTSISLAVTKKVVRNKRATYTASVLLPVSNSGPIHPTGSIEFLDGGKPIRACLSQPLNSALTATCAVKYKSLGKHKISARYSGDPDFTGSASPVVAVQIVVGSSGAPILGFIGSTLEWTFYYHPAYTQVTVLTIFGITPGMNVTLSCRGGGCPFKQTSVPTGSSSSINLVPVFHRHRLRVGAQITLRITRPQWVGKYYSFTVRRGRGPQIVLSCLGVGQARPGVGC
jgi:Bacterial Ig-like domain (group 3)